ncbi:hypothetical protein GCM10009555_001860 [Acrocarpospora macrocephala]|uniref:Uncharacterized protein n=1 Tax=Acrocarpospora macrocephala TaxID=150177 RepID=A0A5M3X4H6_9ACTN|nr:hypothetical protein Amac_102250 [Acrocarpospora macrocephala]
MAVRTGELAVMRVKSPCLAIGVYRQGLGRPWQTADGSHEQELGVCGGPEDRTNKFGHRVRRSKRTNKSREPVLGWEIKST